MVGAVSHLKIATYAARDANFGALDSLFWCRTIFTVLTKRTVRPSLVNSAARLAAAH